MGLYSDYYFTDSETHLVQQIDKNGNFIRQWGNLQLLGNSGTSDGMFDRPSSIAIGDSADYWSRLYVVDAGNSIPIELNDKIKNHIETFKDFTVSWFSPDLPQFRHLDLEWEEVEQLVVGIKRNSDERTKDITLNDGSVIRIDRNEESIRSLYLPFGELEHLKSDLTHLLSLLK